MNEEGQRIYYYDSNGNVQLEHLPTDLRDITMGRYIDAFSKLEGSIQYATGNILGLDYGAIRQIFSVMMTKQMIDLLENSAQSRLSEPEAKTIKGICDRIVNQNALRNRIIHGSWQQVVTTFDDHAVQEWVRFYYAIKTSQKDLSHSDPKMAGKFCFTIKNLEKCISNIEEIIKELKKFYSE